MTEKRVLIVDDDDVVRVGLRTLLAEAGGYEVVGEADNGRDAVKLSKASKPDIIIMDVSMADMNGVDATTRILDYLPETKVLALSMHTDSRFVSQMLEAGASGYLPKLGAVDELPFALRTIDSGRVYLSPSIAGAVLDDYKRGNADSGATRLSTREREVLQLIAEGRSALQIAETLSLSVKTIESHRRNIMTKLDLHSVAELTKYAVRDGLTDLN
jgi:DNA-binding NarL/FixJ family response regulator